MRPIAHHLAEPALAPLLLLAGTWLSLLLTAARAKLTRPRRRP
jgi:hypothetical protein